jgi:plasmid replication initiation protein
MRQDREPNRELVIPTYNFLVATNRSTGRRGYDLMTDALERLSGVRVTTNMETGGEITRQGFGLIGDWEASYRVKEHKVTHVCVELSQWLYRAVTGFEVLTIDKDYFRLNGGIERRIYELCRKHCGHQARWSIGLELLYKKSGSQAPFRNFRGAIKKLAASNHLPEYRLTLLGDLLTVYSRTHKGGMRELKDILGVP